MKKWEYCLVTGIDFGGREPLQGRSPRLVHFSARGMARQEDLGRKAARTRPAGQEAASEGSYIGSVIARLGEEGWEMVGVANRSSDSGTGEHGIYFRREIG